MIEQLVRATRTVRRFQEERGLERDVLAGLVDLARLGGSARNAQPLRYMIVVEPALRQALSGD